VILWRISNHSTLDGGGGLKASGRWHTMGRRVVYCAPNPATALLEVLVHTEIDLEDVPVRFQFLEIEAPDALAVENVEASASRRAGDEWLRAGRTALLRVPSVLVPATWNVLLNPLHPDCAQVRILRAHRHVLDARLLR
jgi:RES domain-containing protein